MKKALVLCLILCLSLCAGEALALEGVYENVCPVNVRYAVLTDAESETATLSFSVFNATEYPISYIEFCLYLYDAEGNPAKCGETHFFRAYAENLNLAPYAERSLRWSLADFAGAAEVREFRMDKVVFEEGTVWIKPEKLYAHPYFYTENKLSADGAYVLGENRELTLIDYSYSSSKRTWYIWNDGPGWVPFSDALVAKCQIWQPGASIKLEINGQAELYAIESFRVALSPSQIGISSYETGQAAAVSPSSLAATKGDFIIQTTLPVGDVPACIGLWDYTEGEERAWSIWNGEEWVTFSYDRGPTCELWRPGISYIRLSYPDAEAVYAIEIVKAEEGKGRVY